MNPLDLLALTCVSPHVPWLWEACRLASITHDTLDGTAWNSEYNVLHDLAIEGGEYHHPCNIH